MAHPERRSSWQAMVGAGAAWAMVADVVTGTVLWGAVGYWLDRLWGTRPWLMSIGFIIGNAAGVYAATLHLARMREKTDRGTEEG
ncbi:MAG: AtpZ/AtpI family protein [Actinomycetota bacterium]